MKMRIFLFSVVLILILAKVSSADEKSDAGTSIAAAKSIMDKLHGLGPWIGPALTMKTMAENYLALAQEAFDAGNYGGAREHAAMALTYANKALGLRAYSLLIRSRVIIIQIC
jgi:hypothetical protein